MRALKLSRSERKAEANYEGSKAMQVREKLRSTVRALQLFWSERKA
jgi:hypothetical protein